MLTKRAQIALPQTSNVVVAASTKPAAAATTLPTFIFDSHSSKHNNHRSSQSYVKSHANTNNYLVVKQVGQVSSANMYDDIEEMVTLRQNSLSSRYSARGVTLANKHLKKNNKNGKTRHAGKSNPIKYSALDAADARSRRVQSTTHNHINHQANSTGT